jgi:hypothetical protein
LLCAQPTRRANSAPETPAAWRSSRSADAKR